MPNTAPTPPPLIALTTGEPAGVGPELCLRIAAEPHAARLVIIGDRDMLAARARQCGFDGDVAAIPDYQKESPAPLSIANIRMPQAAIPGRLNPANARHVTALLDRAIQGCLSGEFAAMVTAPVHKGVINDGGIPFSGHTEYLQAAASVPHVVMLLAGVVDGRRSAWPSPQPICRWPPCLVRLRRRSSRPRSPC